MIAYIWIWAGFAMVVIAAGLAAMPRDVLEAARTDGATRVAGLPPRHRAAARAGSERRLHHDDHQRPQGVRHRDRPRARVDAGERDRDRAGDVADVVQRRSTSASARRSPSSCSCSCCPCSRSTSAASGGRSDGCRDRDGTPPGPGATPVAAKILRSVGKLPLQIFLAVVALLWLVPTIGLFFTSILPASEIATRGLVEDLRPPEPRDLLELQRALPQRGPHGGAEDHRLHRGRRHAARRHRGRARRLRVRLARVPRPRLDLHRRDRAARGAAADGADPDVQALRHVGHLRHDLQRDPLPRRVRAARSRSSSCATSSSGSRRTSSSRPASTGRARSGSSCA